MSLAKNSSGKGPMHLEAIQAMWDAVWGVIQRHKRTGLPLVVWKDEKVTYISPEEAEAEHLAARARAVAEGILPPPDR
jgi:hypothetical protein